MNVFAIQRKTDYSLTARQAIATPDGPNHNGSCEDRAMSPIALPPVEVLRQLLRYDPVTGQLFWLPRDRDLFRGGRNCEIWNRRFSGKLALNRRMKFGGFAGKIKGVSYLAHRVAFAIFHGVAPDAEVDHIDGNPHNNCITNLRAVSGAENKRNRPRPISNKSGVIGVHWVSRNGIWRAAIGVNGRLHVLGSFKDFDAAVAARRAAEVHYGFHPNHGRDRRDFPFAIIPTRKAVCK